MFKFPMAHGFGPYILYIAGRKPIDQHQEKERVEAKIPRKKLDVCHSRNESHSSNIVQEFRATGNRSVSYQTLTLSEKKKKTLSD